MASCDPDKDPAYMSFILEKVFACKRYFELQIRYIIGYPKFRDLLTTHEYELLTLNSTTNSDKLQELRTIAIKRWTFDNFLTFLGVLKTDFSHIAKSMREEYDKKRSLDPCLPRPKLPDLLPPPEPILPGTRLQNVPRQNIPSQYAQVDRQLRKVPKVPISAPEILPKLSRYPMNTSPRGMAMVINNEKFQHLEHREGSSEDKKYLSDLFTFLDYKVVFKNDLKAEEMKDFLELFARQERLKDVSALIVVILTHGMSENIFFGKDGKVTYPKGRTQPEQGTFVTKTEIQRIFNSSMCPSMRNKPKGFIIQACRGVNEDFLKLTQTEPDQGLFSDGDNSRQPMNRPLLNDMPEVARSCVPETADFLFAFPSTDGYKAYRQPSTGSPFIKELCQMIKDHGRHADFESILKKLRQDFKFPLENDAFMMPESTSTLESDWYFF